ncbi:MAG: potassium channel family protein [Microcoleaceae cyanobacterium]
MGKSMSLNFLRELRGEREQFVVIGLGRFGRAVCQTLYESGYEVLAIDKDEKRVNQVLNEPLASHALQLDSTESQALKQAGVYEFKTAIVAVGNFLAESITTTLNLKEGKVKRVIAKASSETHKKILKKVGADLVVFPEREAGTELARKLTRPGLLEEFELDPDHSVVEMLVPEEFNGQTIADLKIRQKYGLNLLAIRDHQTTDIDELIDLPVEDSSDQKPKMRINPPPNERLATGNVIVVLGFNEDINRLLEKTN